MASQAVAYWQQQQQQLAQAQQQPNVLVPTVRDQIAAQQAYEQRLQRLQADQALATFWGDRAAFAQEQTQLLRQQRERAAREYALLEKKRLEQYRQDQLAEERARLRRQVDDAYHMEQVLRTQASTDERRSAESAAISGGAF